MSIKQFEVLPCSRKEIEAFVESNHYSKSINGVNTQYCFKMMHGDDLIGAAIFATFGMANVWKKYSDDKKTILELRRLCCVDDAPKNSESYLIGKCLLFHHFHPLLQFYQPNFRSCRTKCVVWNKICCSKSLSFYFCSNLPLLGTQFLAHV